MGKSTSPRPTKEMVVCRSDIFQSLFRFLIDTLSFNGSYYETKKKDLASLLIDTYLFYAMKWTIKIKNREHLAVITLDNISLLH